MVHLLSLPLQGEEIDVEHFKDEVCNLHPGIIGWCSQEKALSFIDLVLQVRPKVWVEIGVFGGSSLFPVASALKFLKEGVVIGIDSWSKGEALKGMDAEKDAAHIKWWSEVNLDHAYFSCANMLKRFKLEEFCFTLKTTSTKAVHFIPEIDILYLDGNHTEGGLVTDIDLYLPKIRKGGFIWVNDCFSPHTFKGLGMLSTYCDKIKEIEKGNCILYQKR